MGHPYDRQIAVGADIWRRDEIAPAPIGEGRPVDTAMLRVQLPAIDPGAGGRIVTGVFEHEDAATRIPLAPAGRRRIVDVPFVADPVQFGRPDRLCVRSSEERRVGKEGVSTCSSRWSPFY